MAKKPPDRRQPSLFPTDPDESTEPQQNATLKPDGENHDLQNNGSRTPAATPADARAAPQGSQAPYDDGTLRQGTADQPPGLDGTPRPDEAGQRPAPDRQRSDGNSPQEAGGSFASR